MKANLNLDNKMNPKKIIYICEEFLTNFSTHKPNKASKIYLRYFEQFRNLNSLWNCKVINDQDSLELSEVWNSVLHCYKVVLEKISNEIRIKSENVSKEENNQLNLKNRELLETVFQFNNLSYTVIPLIPQEFLTDLLELIKELTLICENMKSYLESNIGLTNCSSTNSLSIVLLLVKIICYKIETNNHDLLGKMYGSTLYCLNILFRIYKIEFTEKWDLILFPEKNHISSLKLSSLLHKETSFDLYIGSDIPFLTYFLFSSNTKIRVNSLLCIQSIFAAPIFRFKSMVLLLCKPFSQQILDTSASSLSKNAVILAFSLLKFGEMIFKLESYDLDTGITLFKTISKIVSTTPSLFWTENFINNEISFINILSNILLSGLKDLNIFIPSLQLFSNILSLIKNCDISINILFDYLNPCFEKVLINSCMVLNLPIGFKYENINLKNLSFKFPVILIEILNFYIKLLENFPFLLISINSNQSLLKKNQFGVKNHLSKFVDILEFINFRPNELDLVIYEKGLRTTYLLINCIREFQKVRLGQKNVIRNQFQISNSDFFFQDIERLEFTINNVEETYLKIIQLLKSFILLTFHSVIQNLIMNDEELKIDSNLQLNRNCICRILDIYSTINPIFLEEALSETMKIFNLKNNEIIYKSKKIKQYILGNTKISFVELILLTLDNAEDKILPSLINILICYCGNSEWIKHSSFTTFQHFEFSLVENLLLLISSDNSVIVKPIKENIILSVNKAMMYINIYHHINTNKVIFCSSNYRKNNINLLEENYKKFMDNNEVEFNEICCLLNWKEIFFSYKSLIQNLEFNSTLSKASSLLNLSEIIRVFGKILKLIPFNLNDLEEIIWTLDLLNNFISNAFNITFRHNKVKWNSIYAIGLLFENDNFYNLVIRSFNEKTNININLSNTFTKSWKALCLIIVNNSELTKVRINALRSLAAYNNADSDSKIPFILLFDTWETFKLAVGTTLISKSNSYYKLQTANNEYSSLWNTYLNKLGSSLYNNSIFYLKNSPNKISDFETEKISRYCFEFLVQKELKNC
ncbi:uncharacterized protein cubi_00007 [Cryptosporidium ubiquitum]|uniref:Uncharacterized protein n=1 Tax=Cryptosporidium ubiquitum TaxID=857276 RepID=A0A1J4MJS5_9CRYT|nr:uncharacterized protein cubi_00007 [Cryptosporidium ubiquitum]OII74454.1 hypothetical protein cubi_00007 [Cryptosporidium ubiquitum]